MHFGMRQGEEIDATGHSYHVGRSSKYYEADLKKDHVIQKDYLYYTIISDGNYQIGDRIRIRNGNYIIFGKQAELIYEQLQFTYYAGGCGNWYIPYIDHDRLTGMEFTGRVDNTQAERMKVSLQIDEPYKGADYEWEWTPVSGNIMYTMPEKGSSVRLYFGSSIAAEGTAASDVRSNGGSMPGQPQRTFSTAEGKKTELHPEHLSMQGGGGKTVIADGKMVTCGSNSKIKMTASGQVRMEAARIHAYTPQEINMYRNITCCEAKGNEIAPKGTKSNPPTGTGDAGFTFNNEFNAMSDTGILCAYEFIRYNPFHDAPEEQANNTDVLCEVLINMEIGLAVVGGVALLAGYAAAVFFSGGAAAVYAPYVVGGLSFLIGSTAVCGVAVNDCERGEASSMGTYVITGALKALEGAMAGATICMVPGYTAGRIGTMFPGGLPILNVYISAKNLIKIAMAGAYTVSSVNAAIKINDGVSMVTGENAVRDTIGAEKYDMIRETSAVLSNLMFIDGILHPEYQKGNNQQGVVGEGGESTARSDELVFGSSTKSSQKLSNQMSSRGWTEDMVRDTVDNPFTIRNSINKATGNSATVFYTERGSYVIVDDVTNEIVQISDNINPLEWIPDASIESPYKP